MTGAAVRWKPWSKVQPGDYLVLNTGVEIVVTLVAPDHELRAVRVTGRIVTAPTPVTSRHYFDRHDPNVPVKVVID